MLNVVMLMPNERFFEMEGDISSKNQGAEITEAKSSITRQRGVGASGNYGTGK